MVFNPFGYLGKESALVALGAPILANSHLQVPHFSRSGGLGGLAASTGCSFWST